MERTFDLAMRGREPIRAPVRPPTRQHATVRQRLQELAAALERADEPQAGAALRVRLYEREQERDHGFRW